MTRAIAVANQKGGVAKTTTVHALGVALAALGDRVLLVDLDPQASLTYSLGIDPNAQRPTVHDCFVRGAPASDVLMKAGDLALLPSSVDLAGSEVHLLSRTGREHVLRKVLEPVRGDYDVVLIDCPPSLGVLTINALTAADDVLIPMQCEALSQRGVSQLIDTITDVREFTNPRLRVAGVVATMYDRRTTEDRRVLESVTATCGLLVLEPPIPRSVRFAEAPGAGRSIFDYAPTCHGAEDYAALAQEVQGQTAAVLAARVTVEDSATFSRLSTEPEGPLATKRL
jgi:chromosome partitioning protein